MNDQLQMAQAWMKASRSCVEVSLVLALAFICSQVFWQAVTAGTFSRAELTAPLTGNLVSAQTERETKAYKILTSADPFLSSERKSATINAAAIDAPVTNLSLKLQGVRAKGDGGGVAFIVLPDNQQVRAEIGSEILDDVSIEYVFHDRVTLLTRGQLETLYLRNPEAVQTGLRPASLTQPALPARAETGAVSAQRFWCASRL
jgi:general secretion pathway protein C